ncbi:uncharacterized protein LOC129613995 [Condylostylus longicornis]|uniref:uncharacterized protein LOC129613995 n=1 Tax=Condylostylus longicornis TaxID=2530218 RepID=UPI00244E20C9|nr:uncharacterized protein LOC129613995 [Condylostylus longicornis]
MSGYPNNSGYFERLLKYASVAGISRDIVNFKKMCRLCMFESEDQDNLDSFIQVDMADTIGTQFSNKQSISFILKNVIGLPISTFRDRDMPQQICRKCIVRIGELYAFQIQCHKIDYLYKELRQIMKYYYLDYDGQNYYSEEIDEYGDNFEVEYLEDNVQAYEVVETLDQYENESNAAGSRESYEKTNQSEETKRPFTPDFPEIIECCFCKQTFGTKKARKRHLKTTHSGIQYAPCMLCPKIFSTRSSCSRHMLKFHGENTRKVCQICFKVKLNREEMKVHLETHKKKPNLQVVENKDPLEIKNDKVNTENKIDITDKVDSIEEALANILDTSTGDQDHDNGESENFTELSDKAYRCPNLECRNNFKTNVTFLNNTNEGGLLAECLNCHLQYPIKTCELDLEPDAFVSSIEINDDKAFQKNFIELTATIDREKDDTQNES